MRTNIRFEKSSRTFTLSPVDIDNASEWLIEKLTEAGVDKSDRTRTRLLLEEALLNLADHFSEEQEVVANLDKHLGRYRLRLVVKGGRFNPLKPEEENSDEWSRSLFSVIDMHIQYTYSMGANVLRMSLPRQSWNPVLKIIIAILAGVIVGALGNILIPDAAQESFAVAVLDPLAEIWIRILQAISGPIIFLTALTATIDTKRIADFGGSRFGTVARYFCISTIVMLFALACARPFFPLEIAEPNANGSLLSDILFGILQVIPKNLIEPFSQADTLQLLLIAIVTGYLLASMESQVKELMTIIKQLNILGLTLARYACSMVPFFVGLLLCLRMWTHDSQLLNTIWIPLVISTVISIVVCLVALMVTSARLRVNPIVLAQKLKKPFVDALKRGTLDFSVIDDLAKSSKRLLGIDADFARAVYPQGLFLYMPTSTVGICVFVLFAAQTQQMNVDQVWLMSLAVLSVVLAVATPPLTGANLLSFVVAFTYLGISNDAFLDVMVFDIVFGVLCIAFDQLMLQIETINQAERMGFLKEETLRAPMPEGAAGGR